MRPPPPEATPLLESEELGYAAMDVWIGGLTAPLIRMRQARQRLQSLIRLARAETPFYARLYRGLPAAGVIPPRGTADLEPPRADGRRHGNPHGSLRHPRRPRRLHRRSRADRRSVSPSLCRLDQLRDVERTGIVRARSPCPRDLRSARHAALSRPVVVRRVRRSCSHRRTLRARDGHGRPLRGSFRVGTSAPHVLLAQRQHRALFAAGAGSTACCAAQRVPAHASVDLSDRSGTAGRPAACGCAWPSCGPAANISRPASKRVSSGSSSVACATATARPSSCRSPGRAVMAPCTSTTIGRCSNRWIRFICPCRPGRLRIRRC